MPRQKENELTRVAAKKAAPKARVLPISSSQSFNPVTDADFINLECARRIARRSAEIAVRAQQEIEDRLRRGARIQSRAYAYDLASGEIQHRGRR
jgi:hypothetical protein